MHTHHAHIRLLLLMIAVVLIGAAAYFVMIYGLSRQAALSGTSTTTPAVGTTTEAVATSTTPATTTPAWEKGMLVVTSSDTNTVVNLSKNERFVIQMGGDLRWTLTFDPATGITRVPNSTTADGIQGIYEADTVGTTTLHATGAPICAPHQACPMFLAVATITLVTK